MQKLPPFLILAVALLPGAAAPSSAASGGPAAAQSPGDSLGAFLITFGPGAAVWERFGHNALWIHDPEAGTDVAYHYGLFDMSEEGFMFEFLQGRMLYSMGTAPAAWIVDAYRRQGRDATVQELRLDRRQIRELQAFLEWNMRPENRVYRYDYFRDNCSTRIADALDRVMDGRLRERLSARPSPVTYREQAVVLTADDPLLTTAMDLGLGPLADQPITRWELTFIPMRLRDDVGTVTVARDGGEISLVASAHELPAIRGEDEKLAVPPHETSTRGRAAWHLLVGVLLGGLLAGAGWLATRPTAGAGARKAARWAIAVVGALWGLVSGVTGLILLALWTLTDHEFAWRNENLLQADPLALGLMVLVPLAVLGGRRGSAARRLAFVLAALSVLGLILYPLPLTRQGNLPIIALALSTHLGLAWTLQRVTRSRPA